jgi:hypothetical protein
VAVVGPIFVVPLDRNPIFFNECPRGTFIGGVHMKWAELKLVRANGTTDVELHCSCSDGITCCSYILDGRLLLATADLLRIGPPSRVVSTCDGVALELKRLELRKSEETRRIRHPEYRAAAVA